MCGDYPDTIKYLLTYLKYRKSAQEVDVLWNAADVQNECWNEQTSGSIDYIWNMNSEYTCVETILILNNNM